MLKKYKASLILITVVLVIAIITVILFTSGSKSKITKKQYENDIYSVEYDSTWDVKTKSESEMLLEYKDGIGVKFTISDLEDEYVYMSLNKILDEIEYSIMETNREYGLIGKQSIPLTKNSYEGYQLLYETEDTGVMVMVAKKGEQLVTITYQSPIEYFDILLDSVKEIVNSFTLIEPIYEAIFDLEEINYSKLSLSKDSSVKVGGKQKYEIAAQNYLVKYELPDFVRATDFDTTWGYFTFNDSPKSMIISVNISRRNVFEWLHACKNEEALMDCDSEGKMDYKDTFVKVNDNEYIYHATYKTEAHLASMDDTEHEIMQKVYVLDSRRIMVIKIQTSHMKITEEMSNSINLTSKTKYSEHLTRKIENGYIVNDMRKMIDKYSEVQTYNQVNISTPDKYHEVDKLTNKYDERVFYHFISDYEYDMEIRYKLETFDNDFTLDSWENYDYKGAARKSLGKKTYGDKEFRVFQYEYKKTVDGVPNVQHYATVMIYDYEDMKLYIRVISEKKKITEQQLIELSNFNIKKLEVK